MSQMAELALNEVSQQPAYGHKGLVNEYKKRIQQNKNNETINTN